jgi:hypothetical protein
MPILMFQAFLVATLLIARMISPRGLKVVAIGWSAFTLIMVFMPWLMALQLAVIWGCYALLRPKTGH